MIDDDLLAIPPFLRREADGPADQPAAVMPVAEPDTMPSASYPKLESMAEITARIKARRRAEIAAARAAIVAIAKGGGVSVHAIMARRPELARSAVRTVLFVDSRPNGTLRKEADVYFLKAGAR